MIVTLTTIDISLICWTVLFGYQSICDCHVVLLLIFLVFVKTGLFGDLKLRKY